MIDIRTIHAKDQAEALAKARIEFGSNFNILSSKDIKSKGFLGLGAKTECQLRILLLNSIYDSRKKTEEEKERDDNRELAKHSGTIDGREMGERIVSINNALQNSSRERLEQTILSKQDELKSNGENNDSKEKDNITFKNLNTNSISHDEIDKKVNELLEKKLEGFINQHLKDKTLEASLRASNQNKISDYLENNIHKNNKEMESIEKLRLGKNKTETLDNQTNNIQIDNSYKNTEYVESEESQISESFRRDMGDSFEDIESSLKYLRRREFPEDMIDEMREYLVTSSNARFFQSKEVIQNEIEKYFHDRLPLANGIDVSSRKKIIVLVGPTGVGKTTTIPKIAAIHLKSSKKVSFITIDNYRIAAVDQMQKYAEIMRIPFSQANTPEALRGEIRKMEQSSLLFVDTMGRSPKGAEDIVALSKYFSAVGRFDVDIQLVMSATVKYNDALDILNSFKITNYKGVILTKLDETDYLASSISAIYKANVPITYITCGQRVPQDISTGIKYKSNILNGLYGK